MIVSSQPSSAGRKDIQSRNTSAMLDSQLAHASEGKLKFLADGSPQSIIPDVSRPVLWRILMARLPVLVCAAFSLIVLAGGCGGSVMNNGRMLQTLTVTPASADAKNFPGGHVQFTVTGTFNMAPVTVMSPAVMWSIGSPFATPSPTMPQASVDSTGLAQCNAFVGTTLVEATAPSEPLIPLIGMTPSTPAVSGTATLVCP